MVKIKAYWVYQGILWICVMTVSLIAQAGFASYIGFLIGFIQFSLVISNAIIFSKLKEEKRD